LHIPKEQTGVVSKWNTPC